MSIVQYTEQEQRLTNTLRLTTEALRAVTAERDALIAELGQPVPLSEWQQMVSERDALRLVERGMQITIDELKADAERYRWLREESTGHPFWQEFDKGMTANEMDATIDQAMEGKS